MGHDHLNVVCEKCGRIADVDIEVPDLREEAASQKWLPDHLRPR